KITIKGWTEQTDISVYDFIDKYISKGIENIFCTDVSKDGAMQGPSLKLYENIIKKFPQLHFIASGGVSKFEDLINLDKIGCKEVIVGKAIYEGKILLSELKGCV
ncbi:MAG TPA: HisA/HisF-related TIM barrel protein, partial [Flavisolibacter sp.]|nr:HisA/HisF-related TIM barrel protein [Flavisolibacter sp.]